jgi:hypothetical protein
MAGGYKILTSDILSRGYGIILIINRGGGWKHRKHVSPDIMGFCSHPIRSCIVVSRKVVAKYPEQARGENSHQPILSGNLLTICIITTPVPSQYMVNILLTF